MNKLNRFNTLTHFLFVLPFLLTTTILQAQHNLSLGISLSHERLPLAELLVPIPSEEPERDKVSIDYFPNEKDSVCCMIDSLSKWHLLYVNCMAQWGMMLQNQAYGMYTNYRSADTSVLLTGSYLYNAFSADSAFTLNRNVHTAFNSPDQHEREWFITRSGDILLFKLVIIDLSPLEQDGINSPDSGYHKEEYWYFFQLVR